MMSQWRIERAKKGLINDDQGNPKETVLSAVPFVGTCNSCKKKGHKEADCRKKNADLKNVTASTGGSGWRTNTHTNKTCNLCGKKGHIEKDCWKNPKNKDKVPDWFKKKKTTSEGGAASVKIELCCLECDVALTSVERFDDNEEEHDSDKRRNSTMTLEEAFAAASDNEYQKMMTLEEAFAAESNDNDDDSLPLPLLVPQWDNDKSNDDSDDGDDDVDDNNKASCQQDKQSTKRK